MKNKTTNGSKVMTLAVIGASVAGLAATAYFFLGPQGKKHQKHAKAWVIKMKGDVVEKLEKARDVSEPIYHEIVDSVAAEYKKGKKAGHKEIDELARDLKKHWKTLSRGAKIAKRDMAAEAKKLTKKVAR